MGSKIKNNLGKQASAASLATDSEQSSPRHQEKIQKEHTQKEKARLDELIPSISRHRYNPSPSPSRSPSPRPTSLSPTRRRSPANIKNIIGKQDPQSSPIFKTVELPPLIPIAANYKFNIILEEEESVDMLTASQQNEDGSDIFSSEVVEDIDKYGYGDTNASFPDENSKDEQEDYDKYGYGETSAPMVIDNEDDEESEDDAAKYGYEDTTTVPPPSTPTSYSPINQYSGKAFCPKREPRRSSMKGSGGAVGSPLSSSSRRSRRASIGASTADFEVLLPGHRTPVQRRRSIVFDKEVDVQNIEPVRCLATNGPQSLWFQENEYETIKIKTLALLDRVDHSSGVIDGKKYCTRGLEKFMTPEATEVMKHQAWDSVLNEQFLQRNDGEFDEDSLANIYKYSTKRSQSEASKRANQDAEVAEAYQKTTYGRQSSIEDWKARTSYNRRMSM